jgi:hypothetical protein
MWRLAPDVPYLLSNRMEITDEPARQRRSPARSAPTLASVLLTAPKEGLCMAMSGVRLCTLLDFSVVLFQVVGVAALCLWRLFPARRWAERGRTGFVIAMLGLGIAGALCGRHDSQFALYAGVTMTVLLIGMNMGSGSIDATRPDSVHMPAEARLAG